MHGVGEVKSISRKTVLGKTKQYYIIDLLNTQMNVMIPVTDIEKTGLRSIVNKREIPKVLALLKESYEDLTEEWKVRYQNNLDELKQGSITAVATVTRNLYKRAKDKKISIMEKKLYELAYSLMVNEVALTKNITLEEANNLLSDALSK